MPSGKGGKGGAASKQGPADLSASHAELATLYASTLTAAAFLAPKGVSCTVGRLAPAVRGLCGLELTGTHLRQMCGLDPTLAIRFAVVASGGVEFELVVRESLRMIATPGAVRSRHKKFIKALAGVAGELPQVAVPPLPAGFAQQREPRPGGSPARSAIATAPIGSPRRDTSVSRAGSLTDVSGLPSPPPHPLRRASIAAPSPPDAGARHEAGRGAGTADEIAQGDAAMAAAVAEGEGDDDWEEEVRPASAGFAGSEVCVAVDSSAAAPDEVWARDGGGSSSGGGGSGRGQDEDEICDVPRTTPINSSGGVARGRPSACERFLRRLRRSPFLKDQIVHYHEQPARPAEYATPRAELAPAVAALLAATGRTRLYSHQARCH